LVVALGGCSGRQGVPPAADAGFVASTLLGGSVNYPTATPVRCTVKALFCRSGATTSRIFCTSTDEGNVTS